MRLRTEHWLRVSEKEDGEESGAALCNHPHARLRARTHTQRTTHVSVRRERESESDKNHS